MAQTAGLLNGTLLNIYFEGTAIAASTSASLDQSMSTREATTKDSAGYKEALEGLREWSISGDFLVSFDGAYTYDDLYTLWLNRTKVTIKYSSEVADDFRYTGEAYLTSLNQSAGVEETVSGSFTLEGTGVLTKETIT